MEEDEQQKTRTTALYSDMKFLSMDGEESGEEVEDIHIKQADLIHNSEYHSRKWLIKTGKEKYIDFGDAQLKELRACFNELDDDGSGAIGVDELEDPLIALGLCEDRDQVQKLVDLVDDDGSS